MIFSKRGMFLNILLVALSASALWVSCDLTTGNNDNNENENENENGNGNGNGNDNSAGYSDDVKTINVDYSGVNNAVFFDFSSGTRTVLPHDFFDIAINAGGNIIANSGSYGSGVQVYKTNETDIAADLSSQQDNVKEFTFKDTLDTAKLYGYQSELNPLGGLGMAASNVCLIKVQHKTTDAAAYFKVVFSMTMGQTQSFNMTVVPGLAAGEDNKTEIKAAIAGITGGYGWLYFKLVGDGGPRVLNTGTEWTGGGTAVPKAADWDILGTRTNELQTEDGTTVSAQMPVAGRSSILLNAYKGVKAKAITGKWMDEVTAEDINDTGLNGEIDAIGYGWYVVGSGMPPTYSVAKNTYVIKTVEGKYVKFQPQTFKGPNDESFVMDFISEYDVSGTTDDDGDDGYPQATLNVDYATANNAVFFDFSTGTVTALPHDFFDIAIDAGGNIIANSGSYGSGVQVYKTEDTDITADLSSQEANVKEYTFKTGTALYDYQAAENPFAGEIRSGSQLGGGSGKVYLIKTQPGNYYKVVFDVFGMVSMAPPTAGYKITVVKGLAGGDGDKTALEDTTSGIRTGFGYIYFDLDAADGPQALNNGSALKEGVTLKIPKAADWDILATRTNELQSTDGQTVSSVMPMVSRSSVLLNTYKEVKAKTVAGKAIGEVVETDLSDDGLSGEIDAIGYRWYSTNMTMPPTYSVPNNTYVIKTAEGKYAKFQPITFAKDGKNFVMDFYYEYKE